MNGEEKISKTIEEELKSKYDGKLYQVGITIPIDDDHEKEYSYRFKRPSVPSRTAVSPPPATRDRMIPSVVLRVRRTRARAIRANAQWVSHIQSIYCRISGMALGTGCIPNRWGAIRINTMPKKVMIPL